MRAVHRRLVGIDVARCLALLGMIATHVLDPRTPTGEIAFWQGVAGGRSSALFAVLAGVSIALTTGRRTPVRGSERVSRSAGLLVRALLVAAMGLPLGWLDSGLAVILTYYGVLFALAIPFLGLRSRALLALAGAWVVLGPLVSFAIRPHLPERGYESPDFSALTEPGRLLSELLFTGYYPAVPWLAYLLLGMAIGRLDLRGRRTQAALLGAGAVAALAAVLVSDLLTRRPGVLNALVESAGAVSSEELLREISGGMYGQTPVDGPWQWLLVVAPHSTTPFDLLHTGGCAAAVIGACLLVVGALPTVGQRVVAVLLGAGTMTLTLYSLHVLMRSDHAWPAEEPGSFGWHVLVVLLLGAGFALAGRRGPLEALVSRASTHVEMWLPHR